METIKIQTTANKTLLFKTGAILFAAMFTSTVLLFYSFLLKHLVPSSNLIREYCICFGQIFFQGAIILLFIRKNQILFEYLYQMMMVSLLGGLLLLPVLVSALLFFPFNPGSYYYLAYFFMVVLFMFFNHKKRVKKINAPAWLTYTWILYRLIVLLIIL